MSVVRQVQELLSQHRTDQSPELPRVSSQLYRCAPCAETYISDGMDSCPSCESPVETIPTERDLGFV